MKILVIGGTHFIGLHVVHRLHKMGHEITVFNRGETRSDLPLGVNRIQGDRKNLTQFKTEFDQLSPQVVLDMIAFTEQDAHDFVNTFKGIAQRAVVISSQDVYHAYDVLLKLESSAPDSVPLKEDSPLRSHLYPFRNLPEKLFDRSDDYEKILVEKVVMNEPDLPSTILRLPMVYGPRDFRRRLFPYLKRMDDNRPAIVLEESFAQWRGSYGYVENVAEAIALAVTHEQAANRIYNVSDTVTLTEAKRIRAIGRIAGWNGEVIVLPKSQMPKSWKLPYNTDQDWVIDATRIRQELSYSEPIPFDEALRRTIEWDRQHPPDDSSKWTSPELLDYATEDAILASLPLD
jgi:nucleoside-diphosphate-sugar epimerase